MRFTNVHSVPIDRFKDMIDRASVLRDVVDSDESVELVLDGSTVANLFFEPSTRTRLSFDLAAQRLGARVLTYDPSSSSALKGESLRDTVLTVEAVGADILVVRHGHVGVPDEIAGWTGCSVINAGDGVGQHPTQTLLDMVTIKRHFGQLDGVRMAVVGDVSHSRVANGLIDIAPELGIKLTLVGPDEWLPEEPSVPATSEIGDVLGQVEVLYLLRVQTERGGEISNQFITRFGIDRGRVGHLNDDAMIMHPGPINRGVEITGDIADGPRSLILEQVRNATPARMAVLEGTRS